MSKGSPVIPVRIDRMMLCEIAVAIKSANSRRRKEPYKLSSWVRAAIQEKLDHLARKKTNVQQAFSLDRIIEEKTPGNALETSGVFLGEADTPGLATHGCNEAATFEDVPAPPQRDDGMATVDHRSGE